MRSIFFKFNSIYIYEYYSYRYLLIKENILYLGMLSSMLTTKDLDYLDLLYKKEIFLLIIVGLCCMLVCCIAQHFFTFTSFAESLIIISNDIFMDRWTS